MYCRKIPPRCTTIVAVVIGIVFYMQEIVEWARFVIIGSEAQVFYWKGFGFKLHVPRNALDPSVSNCTIFVKAFLPNKNLELPVNSQLISAIYHISMPSPDILRKAVDIEIEHWVIPCQINTKKSLPPPIRTKIGSYTVSVKTLIHSEFQCSMLYGFRVRARRKIDF